MDLQNDADCKGLVAKANDRITTQPLEADVDPRTRRPIHPDDADRTTHPNNPMAAMKVAAE